MQGVFVAGQRPRSKKAVREAVAAAPETVQVEATSIHGGEYDGTVDQMPQGTVFFTGPDPWSDRKFYGQIIRKGEKVTVK